MSRYDNDRLYADHEFVDETSQFDPKGYWQGGLECYFRTYRCRVPRKMLQRAESAGNFDKVVAWIERHADRPGIWRN